MIFLAGASRGVGREIAKILAQQDKPVTALIRTPSYRAELETLGITVVEGDALDAEAVKTAMQVSSIDTVISTIGGLPKDGQRADYQGNKNLIDAAKAANASKYILISSIGSGNSRVALPPQALETLGAVLKEKEQAEEYLINSGLTYTVIRPGGLKSEPATGNGMLTDDYRVAGTIHRADVAQLVCQCLEDSGTDNRIFAAVDRNMTYTNQS
jgi:nucleoside-diphosphate-sugar epimerase